MSASEMSAFSLPGQGIVAGPTVGGSIEAMQSLGELIFEYSLEVDMDEIAREVQDIDGV